MNEYEEFWTHDRPIGEVVPEQLNDVIHKAIAKVGVDIYRDRDAVVQAAKDLRRLELAGVNQGDDVWVDAMQRQRDAVDRLPVVFDIPGALIENRRAEVERLDVTGLARAVLSGGAS